MRTTAAIFDVDRTLIRFPSERLFFLYLLGRRVLTPKRAVRFLTELFCQSQGRYTNKSYLQGLEKAQIQRLAQDCYGRLIRPRLSITGLACLREHQRRGHQTVILTGSLEFLMQPLQVDLQTDWLIATTLEITAGRCTGRIQGRHPRGLNKLLLLQELSRTAGFSLAQSYAYADHVSDLPLLEQVGHPIAVNPAPALKAIARQRAWPIYRF